MNFELTEAQRMLREMVREFSEKEIKPRAAEIDRTDEFPWDLWKRMAELGILSMTLPPEYGGSGMDIVSWAIAQEEMARAAQAKPLAGTVVMRAGRLSALNALSAASRCVITRGPPTGVTSLE